MPRKPRQLPAQNTLPYLLLTLTALCGEYPIRQISRLPGGSAYLESVVTALRRDGLLRTFSKDGLRGLRLTSSAKRLLLADAPEWFSAYLTGSSEPNKLKSEIPRRLRLHRMAEILTIMHNADIPAFPWEKVPFSAMVGQNAESPAYYTSREIKEIGPQGTKIRSSRATGILLTDGGIFLTYNTAKAQMKWEYKAELRFKALLQTEGVMPDAEISGIVFGSTMEQLSALMQPDAHNYFLLDGSFPHFYYLTNDRYGEAILRLLCDAQQRRTLDTILAEGLHEGIPNWRVENDAIDSEGNPVLFAYQCCTWVNIAMQKHSRKLQLAARRRLKQYNGKWIPANQTRNLPRVHQQYKQKIPSIKYRDIYVGFTALTFCRWERTPPKNQAETPYTDTGRQLYFERTKKKKMQARLDEMYSDRSARAISYGKWGKFNNFEFIMNRAYALNRDKLRCRVCGGWLIANTPWAHRINPYLPLDKVNRVNNLISLHKKCFIAVNNPNQDISEFDVKAQKKIVGYRDKLVISHTRNK